MIQFDQVSKRYPASGEVLRQVSLAIPEGAFVLVTGHSGAGKTTLIKLMAGIEKASSGTVLIANQNVSRMRPAQLPFFRRRFGLVFQDHKLLYDRNCYENVALPLYINGITGLEAGKRIRAALDKVGLLHKEKAMPISLSGGEQQRLAIARAVISRPSILIADEPTGNLDDAYAHEIMQLFYAFHQVGTTVIVSTHHVPNDAPVGHHMLYLEHGTLTAIRPQESQGNAYA